MTHRVTIPPPDGGNRTAYGSYVGGSLEWEPPHDLSPQQERRRIERVEGLLRKAAEILNSPAGEEGHVE